MRDDEKMLDIKYLSMLFYIWHFLLFKPTSLVTKRFISRTGFISDIFLSFSFLFFHRNRMPMFCVTYDIILFYEFLPLIS